MTISGSTVDNRGAKATFTVSPDNGATRPTTVVVEAFTNFIDTDACLARAQIYTVAG